MTRTAPVLRLVDLGSNQQAAIRALLDLFRDHGWRDQAGAALKVVEALSRAQHGLTSTRVTNVLPDEFYLRNHLTKSTVRSVLDDLMRSKRTASSGTSRAR